MSRAFAKEDTLEILVSVQEWHAQHAHDADALVLSRMSDVRDILNTVVTDLEKSDAVEFPKGEAGQPA
jgi:hypothetical protein